MTTYQRNEASYAAASQTLQAYEKEASNLENFSFIPALWVLVASLALTDARWLPLLITAWTAKAHEWRKGELKTKREALIKTYRDMKAAYDTTLYRDFNTTNRHDSLFLSIAATVAPYLSSEDFIASDSARFVSPGQEDNNGLLQKIYRFFSDTPEPATETSVKTVYAQKLEACHFQLSSISVQSATSALCYAFEGDWKTPGAINSARLALSSCLTKLRG